MNIKLIRYSLKIMSIPLFLKPQFILPLKVVPCQDMNDLRIIPLAVTLTANCILLANIEGHT